MAEMYLNGSGEPTGSQDLREHADNVSLHKRTKEEQADLDSIWCDRDGA